jgi:type I restriction enzyme, S subunit
MPRSAIPTNRSSSTTVAFGDVVRLCTERSSDPKGDGFKRYIGLEHLDPGELRVRRWGDLANAVTFTNVFRPGQVLFGKRRAYQRKVAVADFSGVCSGDIYVLEAKGDALLPELLPFICQTEAFFEHAVGTSAGSLSPRTNWESLADFEFVLPPINEQRRALQALTAAAKVDVAMWNAREKAISLRTALQHELVEQSAGWDAVAISDLCHLDAPLCYGVVQPGDHDPAGVPLLRVCDIEASTIRATELKRVTPDIDASYRRSRVAPGDVLVSVVGTIGRVFVVSDAESGFNIARAIARIRTDKCDPHYLSVYLRSPQVQRELTGEAFETARKTLNLEALGQIEVPVPPNDTQAQWRRRINDLERALAGLNVRFDEVRRLRHHMAELVFAEGES